MQNSDLCCQVLTKFSSQSNQKIRPITEKKIKPITEMMERASWKDLLAYSNWLINPFSSVACFNITNVVTQKFVSCIIFLIYYILSNFSGPFSATYSKIRPIFDHTILPANHFFPAPFQLFGWKISHLATLAATFNSITHVPFWPLTAKKALAIIWWGQICPWLWQWYYSILPTADHVYIELQVVLYQAQKLVFERKCVIF